MRKTKQGRMTICVVTHDFPTDRQPYRGAPIWKTMLRLEQYADVSVICPVPWLPGAKTLFGERSGIYNQLPSARERCPGPERRALRYPAIPVLTHPFSGDLLAGPLTRAIARLAPDIVLSYWIYPEAHAAITAGRRLGIPVIAGSRGSDLKVVERSRRVRCNVATAVSNADRVLTVSRDLEETAVALGAPRQRVRTVINGVDTEIFCHGPLSEARSRLGIAAGRRVVFFVGRLVAMKGVLQLVEAMTRMKAGNERWTVAIAGEGPLMTALRRHSEALGIGKNVVLLGALKPAEVATWMNAADLLCLPSLSEGCPNVVQEALSCGCPVVATGVGGVPELVDDTCGIVVSDNQPDTLCAAFSKAAAVRWDRAAIASSHRRDWDQAALETVTVCEEVVGNRSVRERLPAVAVEGAGER